MCVQRLKWKKRSEETQTLRAGCSKAEPNISAPPQTHFPGAREGRNLIIWRWSLLLPTNPVWWGSMHAISNYRGNRPKTKQTQPNTHKQTGPITIHCAAASAQCNNNCVTRLARHVRRCWTTPTSTTSALMPWIPCRVAATASHQRY